MSVNLVRKLRINARGPERDIEIIVHPAMSEKSLGVTSLLGSCERFGCFVTRRKNPRKSAVARTRVPAHSTREPHCVPLTPSGSDSCGYTLDEQLYSKTEGKFFATNRAAMRRRTFDTMFLVSHSPEILDGADQVMTFTHGSITLI